MKHFNLQLTLTGVGATSPYTIEIFFVPFYFGQRLYILTNKRQRTITHVFRLFVDKTEI
jgi:hypothetical protein